MDHKKVIQEIVEKLKQADPYKIILFGSYAYGVPNVDSDLDILVVTSDNYLPENYSEKSKVILKVVKLIKEEKSQYPIDLIIYTMPMYEKFIQTQSMFSKEILTKGKILYEKDNTRLA